MVKILSIVLLSCAYTVLFFSKEIAATHFFVLIYSVSAVSWVYRGHLSLPWLSVVHALAGCYLAFVSSLMIVYSAPFRYDREWHAIFGVLLGAIGLVGTRNYWVTLLLWIPIVLILNYTLAFALPIGAWEGEGDLWRFATVLFVFGIWQILKSGFDLRRYKSSNAS
jgi:hypothetical protein